MNSLVLYNSKYGNTEQIARAIGTVLATYGPSDVRSIRQVDEIPPGTGLLVVGGPTQGHGMDQQMKTFLGGLPAGAFEDVRVAAFDTRLKWPILRSGSAAREIAKRLRRLGGQELVKPGSFLVAGGEGPLVEGEIDRATAWAEELAEAAMRNARILDALDAGAAA